MFLYITINTIIIYLSWLAINSLNNRIGKNELIRLSATTIHYWINPINSIIYIYIQPSNVSHWFLLHFIFRFDFFYSYCTDYRAFFLLKFHSCHPLSRYHLYKIGLRSRYHQLKIKAKNIPKIVFQTQYKYYEFLIMSFGSTNVLTSFMDMMNRVFKLFMDKFIIVFIDNILVYSRVIKSMRALENRLVNLEGAKVVCKFFYVWILVGPYGFLGSRDFEGRDPNWS